MSLADWAGTDYSQEVALYAQGAHVRFIDGKLVERSHGLRIFPASPEEQYERIDFRSHGNPDPEAFYLVEPAQNVPENIWFGDDGMRAKIDAFLTIGAASDLILMPGLEDLLRTALNSDGDSLALHVEAHATGGPFGNAGVEIEMEFEIERQADGTYEVKTESGANVLAGAEVWENFEGEVSSGRKLVKVYRFHSLQGLCRGIRGFPLAMLFPDLTPLGNDHGIPGLAPFELAQNALNFAQALVVNLQQAQASAKAFKDSALAAYNAAPWWANGGAVAVGHAGDGDLRRRHGRPSTPRSRRSWTPGTSTTRRSGRATPRSSSSRTSATTPAPSSSTST